MSTEPVQEKPVEPNDTTANPPVPAKVGLNEAARLTGASKTTILKYAEEGKLSFELNGAGKKVYQVAELQRVFEKLKVQTSPAEEQIDRSIPDGESENTTLKLALLEAENRFLKEKLEAEEDKARREAQNAEDWKQQCQRMTLMLTHQSEPTPQPEPIAEPKRGFLNRLFGGNR